MKNFITFLFSFIALTINAQITYRTDADVSYIPLDETDTYRVERCKLDVYYPESATDFPTIVWFHGGGLTGGNKSVPPELKEKGFAVIAVNYRLSPRATNPAYIEDAAESLAWVFEHIEDYGGNKEKIIVSGHSAGGYLSLMLALDKSYLAKHGIDSDKVIAWFPLSGQTMTHYTIREERRLPDGIPVVDRYAPVNCVRKDTPPIFLITGDRDMELAARYEENALLYAVLKSIGNEQTYLYELQGFDHGNMYAPGCYMMVEWMRKHFR